MRWLKWQGKKVSNPRPTVLETAALPAELFPYINLCTVPTKSKPSAAGSIWKGISFLKHRRMPNPVSGAIQESYDVVDRQGLEPRTDRL